MKITTSARCGLVAPAAKGCSWDLASKISQGVILRTPCLEWFAAALLPNTAFVQAPGLRAGQYGDFAAQADGKDDGCTVTPDPRRLCAADSSHGAEADHITLNPHSP